MPQLSFDFVGFVDCDYCSDDFYTPKEIVDASRKCMGSIDLDPCSDANNNVGAKTFWTKKEDGLSKAWNPNIYKTVFVNPPFSNILPFVLKFCGELGDAKGIFLVRYDSSTFWFQLLQESSYMQCFGMFKKKPLWIRPNKPNNTHRDQTCIFFRNIKYEKVQKYFSSLCYIAFKVNGPSDSRIKKHLRTT